MNYVSGDRYRFCKLIESYNDKHGYFLNSNLQDFEKEFTKIDYDVHKLPTVWFKGRECLVSEIDHMMLSLTFIPIHSSKPNNRVTVYF